MNRYSRTAAAVLMVSGFGSVGCVHTNHGVGGGDRYRNVVDTSWPERYNYAAREAVLAPFAQQVTNGHFQEQTLWNWYFELGSDRLHPAGLEKLDALSRNNIDTKIYLQHAGDLPLSPDNAGKINELRAELTAKRAAAVRQYLASKPGAPQYDIAVHNGPTPGIYSFFTLSSFRGQRIGYVGSIGGASGLLVGGSSGGNTLGTNNNATGAGGGTTPTPNTPSGPTGGGTGGGPAGP